MRIACGETNSIEAGIRDSFVSFGADGFTLNHLEGASAKYFYFVALKGGRLAARGPGHERHISAPTARFGGKEAKEPVAGTAAWLGLEQHYFLAAMLPTPEMGECVFFRGPVAGELGAALRLPIDRQLDVTFRIFQGPKRLDLLRAQGRELDTAVDYGSITNLFAFFARILLWVMQKLELVVKNWGISIILLTVVVKGLLYPLTAKSMQSRIPWSETTWQFVKFTGSPLGSFSGGTGIGEPMRLKAEVVKLNELSGHADQRELLLWLKPMAKTLKRVFIVHGEPSQQTALAKAIRDEYNLDVVIPARGESFTIN